MWLQSRVAGRKANQVDLRFESEFLVFNHDLAQEFGTEAVHRRLAVLSVHQAGELFQLHQHLIFEVPFLTELPERFIKPGELLLLVQGPNLPLPFEGTGTVFSTEYIHPTKRRTVVFSKGYCEIRKVD